MAKRDGFYKRGRFWWCTTDPITRRAKSTQCTDLIAAKAWKAGRERELHDPAYALASKATFGEWAAKLIAMKAKKLKPISLRLYPQYFGHWVRLIPESTKLMTIIPGTYDEFISLRRGDGVTDYTIGRELTAMSTLLRLAKRAGCYPGDLEGLRPVDFEARSVKGERALTPEEFLLLVPKLNPTLLAFVCIAIALGCRRSEAFQVQAISEDASSVHIAGTKTEGADRVVPVLSHFRRLLDAARPYLPLRVIWNLNRDLWDACDAAGIPRCCPNDLRRTHASWLKEKGVDSDTVRRLMGHQTSKLVDTVYGRPRPEKLAQLAERAFSLDTDGHDIPALPEPRTPNLPWRKGVTEGSYRLAQNSANADDPAVVPEFASENGLGTGESRPERIADHSRTLQSVHPPAAWSLAVVAESVLSRSARLVSGTIRKARRDVG